MEISEFLLEYLDYNYQTNQTLIQTLLNHKNSVPVQGTQLLNHVLNAHQIWNNRIQPRAVPFGVMEIHPWEELLSINEINFQQSCWIVQNRSLTEVISYQNSKGQNFSNTIQDILFHVINHSTYHRGQIAMNCKASGITPIVSDYIVFKR